MSENIDQITKEILSIPGWTLTALGDEVGLSAQSIMRFRDGLVEPKYSDALSLIAVHKKLFRKKKTG